MSTTPNRRFSLMDAMLNPNGGSREGLKASSEAILIRWGRRYLCGWPAIESGAHHEFSI